MSCYSISDLVELLQNEGSDRVLLESGSAPTLIIDGELLAIEGLVVVEDSLDEMLRSVASTREIKTFRQSGVVDFVLGFDGSRYLIRAFHAFGVSRVEVQPITLNNETSP